MNNIFFSYHINKYPFMETQDKIKLIYQGVLGPRHLVNSLDLSRVKEYLVNELSTSKNENENLYEWVSDSFLRINIHSYIKNNLDIDYLINSFYSSSTKVNYNIDLLKSSLNKYISDSNLMNYDYKPIHHSKKYNELYLPHYRLIHKDYLTKQFRLIQLKDYLSHINQGIVAIEGKCASGKTTLCSNLNQYSVLHVDDFFLPHNKKTIERLNEIGGNIDYELIRETLIKIKNLTGFETSITYKAFDCSKQEYYNKNLLLTDIIILEGVYSTHPFFKDLIDKIIYIELDDKTQIERINNRVLKEKFINEWIPLENKYFDSFDIYNICDIII